MSHEQQQSSNSRRNFKQFNASKRHSLQTLIHLRIEGKPLTKAQIAKELQCHISTIYRELERGRVTHLDSELREYETYSADYAIERHAENVSMRGIGLKIGNQHRVIDFAKQLIEKRRFSHAIFVRG